MIQSHSQVLKQTDASKKGWGIVCQGISTGGQRSYEEQLLYINVLELKTVKLALLTFTEQKSLKAFHFQIDNATALLYLVKMVGTGGGKDRGGGGEENQVLLKLSKEIWQYLLKHQITILLQNTFQVL